MLSPVVFLVFVCVFLPATATAVVGDGMTVTLPLERAFPTSHGVEVSQLKARDRVRHGRILQSSYGVVDFPVEGTYDPFLVGLYFTRVQLGSPPKEFYVQIDTGSDVLWVSCASCNGCPTSSGLQQIQLDFFDPSSSSTARPISCSDQRCALGEQSSDSGCSTQNQCSYTFQYGDGSGTSGYYVADFMHFNTIVGNSLTSNSSAPVVFGCSTSQTGDLTKPDRAIDGIFGFGQQGLSVIAQLSSQRVTPNVFSHCLKGSNGGGGILVLGQIVEPNLVYTPLVPSQPHYNLNLQSIALNGQTMPISPEVFETSSNRGTIVDSGTTLAYLAEEAYDPFINAINQAVSQNVRPLVTKGNQCYLTTSSVGDIFPTVSLTFAGGATMVLRAADYLIQQNSIGGAAVWCMGFQKIPGQGLTILGDLVLKDKIIVYDLAGQRVGWANYDCSQAVNVSATTSRGKTEYVNAGQIGNNSSPRSDSYKLLLSFILTSVLHVLVRGRNSIL
ncbi:PREDICTED: aspartic proteinase-like protein 2 isoform X1 [Nicotiana attenuata]|uniref:Aspartic proteinase-like protein 2 n=1 Tax=Nicotiana attenuata TaxID=49451 RepID=A0A314KLF5_NICAT|nr:PREDICTED: aspartic proteinase-like protein 2 isoform X1 [Nicotiana attenuata]OIT29549.1 aspartic proteinase-like protein 2 [Nicotiana attenuata]